jgi:hypothetical protein
LTGKKVCFPICSVFWFSVLIFLFLFVL